MNPPGFSPAESRLASAASINSSADFTSYSSGCTLALALAFALLRLSSASFLCFAAAATAFVLVCMKVQFCRVYPEERCSVERQLLSCTSTPYGSNGNVTTGQVTGDGDTGGRRRLLSPRRRLFTNVVASSSGKARTVSSQRADNGDGWFEYYTKSLSVAILDPLAYDKWGTAMSRNSRLLL